MSNKLKQELYNGIYDIMVNATNGESKTDNIVRLVDDIFTKIEIYYREDVEKCCVKHLILSGNIQDAPNKTSWGAGMKVVNIAISNDETAFIYFHNDAIKEWI